MRAIVWPRGLPTPRRPLLVPTTDQALASSNTRYRPPRRNTDRLLVPRHMGHLHPRTQMGHLPGHPHTAHLPADLEQR